MTPWPPRSATGRRGSAGRSGAGRPSPRGSAASGDRDAGRTLVVRGAVPAAQDRLPIPLSIRACGFPAHGLPTGIWTWLRRLRVSDGPHELVQALVVEPGAGPTVRLTGPQVATALLDEQ